MTKELPTHIESFEIRTVIAGALWMACQTIAASMLTQPVQIHPIVPLLQSGDNPGVRMTLASGLVVRIEVREEIDGGA